MKSSDDLRLSEPSCTLREAVLVTAGLSLLIAISVTWCFRHDYILYYGDAQSHLNSSRALIDSRTPGYEQLGTPWLPLLHIICLPLVMNDWLWSTGLAGSVPVAMCFVVAGLAFYAAAKEEYQSTLAAVVVLACFALNPNVLYLGSIPMTEIVFLAGVATLLFALLRYRRTQATVYLGLGVVASWGMSLTRFDGWFLIPFAVLGFVIFSKQRRLRVLIGLSLLLALAPLYWLAHNWWETSNALDFYNGPFSPSAIQGPKRYPGYHDWGKALKFYSKAAELCAGWGLMLAGGIGILSAISRRRAEPLLFLFLIPAFYVLSIHSSNTPVWVPALWYGSYYNIRYGLAVVPLLAFAVGAVADSLPSKRRHWNLLIPAFCLTPWLLQPSIQNVICWKEAQVNSVARRAWTAAGARFLAQNYHSGEGILLSAGDVMGILCRERIALAESLNIGNGPAWIAATARPDLVHGEKWVIAQAGDALSRDIGHQRVAVYQVWQEYIVPGAPMLEIYRRNELPFPIATH